MSANHYYVYIMTNKPNGTLYTGVTNDLPRRIWEHKNHLNPESFTARYNLQLLVYYEHTTDVETAIRREKQIKAGNRSAKIQLITSLNPGWEDLYDSVTVGTPVPANETDPC